MTAPSYHWVTRPRLRPDRYQDWQEQLAIGRRSQDGTLPDAPRASNLGDALQERWASVSIKSKSDPADSSVVERNLRCVKRLVDDTASLASDDAAPPVAMTGRQYGLLNDAIAAATDGRVPQDIFSAYMRVQDIYKPGSPEFGEFDAFEIRHADPPVPGLELSRILNARARTSGQKGLNPPPAAIAIIDDGIAFANERFRSFQGGENPWATHFAFVWLQDIERPNGSSGDGLVEFGQELFEDQINDLLNGPPGETPRTVNEAAVYRAVGARLNGKRPVTLAGSATHGAHVLDIATGGQSDIPIYAVQLPTTITEDTSGQLLSYYAREGLKRIIEVVNQQWGPLNVPLIINFSYGFQAGPKDGSAFVVQELDRLVQARRDQGQVTELILPAGNTFEADTHAIVELAPVGPGGVPSSQSLTWQISPDDRTESFVEIHVESDGTPQDASDLIVSLTHPTLASTGSARLDPLAVMALEKDGWPIAGLYWEPAEGHFAGRLLLAVNRTNARFADGREAANPGAWTIRFENTSQDKPTRAHVTVQRDDTLSGFRPGGRQSHLEHAKSFTKSKKTGAYNALDLNGPVTARGTLSALSGSEVARIVGAATVGTSVPAGDHVPANAIDNVGLQPSRYTASGPTVGRPDGPDASAVVDEGDSPIGTYATGTFSGSSYALDGTSMAAPQIARALVAERGDWSALESESTTINGDRQRLGRFVVDRRLLATQRLKDV